MTATSQTGKYHRNSGENRANEYIKKTCRLLFGWFVEFRQTASGEGRRSLRTGPWSNTRSNARLAL